MINKERVKYKKCPLIEVTYQINFPPILSIEAMEPVVFQERIRNNYPNYEIQITQPQELIVNTQGIGQETTINALPPRKQHFFLSEDQKWRIALTNDMLAFSTIEYQCWEDMEVRSKSIIESFVDSYKPLYYTRVGLRYIDAIDRVYLKLENTPWNELLNVHLCGCLIYSSEEGCVVRNSSVNSEMSFGDIFVNVASGTGTVDHHDGMPPHEAYILNCDYYYTKKVELADLLAISNKLHDRSHMFFRDSITEKLHEAMIPEKLQG